MRRFLTPFAIAATVLWLAVPGTAEAQERFAVRAGATVDPDQFHFGFMVDFGEVATDLRLRPSLELGVGDDRTIGAANIDVHYFFSPRRDLRPYAGGGVGFAYVDRDFGNRDSTDFEAGINLLAGIEFGRRPASDVPQARGSGLTYLIELRAGLGDIPDWKLTFGVIF